MSEFRRQRFFQIIGDSRIIELYWLCYGEYRGKRELGLFLRYVDARVKKEYRDETYRIYMSETLRLLPQGKALKTSYADVIKEHKSKETRNGKAVAEAAAAKMGIKINWGGES